MQLSVRSVGTHPRRRIGHSHFRPSSSVVRGEARREDRTREAADKWGGLGCRLYLAGNNHPLSMQAVSMNTTMRLGVTPARLSGECCPLPSWAVGCRRYVCRALRTRKHRTNSHSLWRSPPSLLVVSLCGASRSGR
jgi:hypothetical protein